MLATHALAPIMRAARIYSLLLDIGPRRSSSSSCSLLYCIRYVESVPKDAPSDTVFLEKTERSPIVTHRLLVIV